MRAVPFFTACLTLLWASTASGAGSCCRYTPNCADRLATPWVMPEKGQTTSREGNSSFRGITLQSSIHDVEELTDSLGLTLWKTTFVGRDTISSIDLSRNCEPVGNIDFDERGQIRRLMFSSGFFTDGVVRMREFADTLFERYSIRPLKLDDDVCFQDVTCFRGTSPMDEQFLLLRIGADVQLYVRPEHGARGATTN